MNSKAEHYSTGKSTREDLDKSMKKLMKKWGKYSKQTWPEAPFVVDGIFPEYEKQGTRVLFIGRESYGTVDHDYLNAWMDGGEMKATDNFHSRLLYLAYGILNGEYTLSDWLGMRDATQLTHVFAENDGFSFAFMNASKLNNNSGSKQVDACLFSEFIADPKNQEFFLKEIEIIAPDIIISANLGDVGFMESFLKNKKVKAIEGDPDNCFLYYELTSGDKTIPWLDGWHFSASKYTFEDFYQPICKKAKEILSAKK